MTGVMIAAMTGANTVMAATEFPSTLKGRPMQRTFTRLALGSFLALATATVAADDNRDVDGLIQSINPANQSFVVEGKTFHTTPKTRYDDGLTRFTDLKVGQDVEVDYRMRDGRYIATEIELDD